MPYAAEFARVHANLPGAGVAWIDALRARAMSASPKPGLPTIASRSLEIYRSAPSRRGPFDDAAPRPTMPTRDALPPLLVAEAAPSPSSSTASFAPTLSKLDRLPRASPPGRWRRRWRNRRSWWSSISAALPGRHAPVGWSRSTPRWSPTASCWSLDEGRRGRAPAGAAVHRDRGRRRCRASASTWSCSATARARPVVERYRFGGAASGLANAVTEIALAAGAALRHYKLQERASGSASHIATVGVLALGRTPLTRASRCRRARRCRATRSRVELEGEGAHAALDGAYLARGRQHADTTTLIDHAAPGCASREIYQGGARRPGPRRLPGPHPGPRGRPEDRRPPDQQDPAAVGRAPRSTPSRSWRSTPTTSSAATAPPPASSTSNALFYLRARGIPRRRRAAC